MKLIPLTTSFQGLQNNILFERLQENPIFSRRILVTSRSSSLKPARENFYEPRSSAALPTCGLTSSASACNFLILIHFKGLYLPSVFLMLPNCFSVHDTVDVAFPDESVPSHMTFTENEWDPTARQDTHYISNLYNP